MKKIVLPFVLLASLCIADNKDYVGLGIGGTTLGVESQGTKADTSGGHVSLTLGHYYENGRFNASYTYFNSGAGVKNSDLLSLAYDFLLPLGETPFCLYVGPVAGYTRYVEYGTTGNDYDLSGVHYGAELGGIYNLSDSFELEAGYRYLLESKAEKVSMFYFNINYHFDADKYFKYD
jgi:hypothetical protein